MDKQRKKQLLQSYKAQPSVGGVYSISNIVTGKRILSITMDITGSRNRFEFVQQMNSCVHPQMQDDWARLGGKASASKCWRLWRRRRANPTAIFGMSLRRCLISYLPGNRLTDMSRTTVHHAALQPFA